MDTKHTPGPWTHESKPVLTGGSWSACIVFQASAIPPHGPKHGSIGIAVVQYNKDANARLIAAAPDLLAALQEAIETVGDMDHDYLKEGVGDPIAHWRAAIRKATGQDGA